MTPDPDLELDAATSAAPARTEAALMAASKHQPSQPQAAPIAAVI